MPETPTPHLPEPASDCTGIHAYTVPVPVNCADPSTQPLMSNGPSKIDGPLVPFGMSATVRHYAEKRKFPRRCLLPVIPTDCAYFLHYAQYPSYDLKTDGRIHYLKKYGHRMADEVLCYIASPWYIDLVERETGKKIVPYFCFGDDSFTHFREGATDVWTYEPSPADLRYLAWLKANNDRWPYVSFSNLAMELVSYPQGTNPMKLAAHPVVRGKPAFEVLSEIRQRFPPFDNKLCVAPWDIYIEEDANIGWTDDGLPPPLAGMLAGCLVPVYMGYNWLYPNLTAQLTALGLEQSVGTLFHQIQRTPDKLYPYPHIKKWLHNLKQVRGMNFSYGRVNMPPPKVYSGIGFTRGASIGHLGKLIEFGYDGALFFLPPWISEEGDAMMEMYLTEVEGG